MARQGARGLCSSQRAKKMMCWGTGSGPEGSGELLKRLSRELQRALMQKNTHWLLTRGQMGKGETGSRETDHLGGYGKWGLGWWVAVGHGEKRTLLEVRGDRLSRTVLY